MTQGNTLILTNSQVSTIRTAVLRGLEVAAGAKSSATHYHKRKDQQDSVRTAVAALRAAGRELPVMLAAQPGTTGYFAQEALVSELKNGFGAPCTVVNPMVWLDERVVDHFTDKALSQMEYGAGVPYVVRFFASLRAEKINNARSRRLFAKWYFGHSNMEFITIKYRGKIRAAMKHLFGGERMPDVISAAYSVLTNGVFQNERESQVWGRYVSRYSADAKLAARCVLFAFKKDVRDLGAGTGQIIDQYYAASRDVLAKSSLPVEVLEGLVSDKRHPQYAELWGNKEKRKATRAKLTKSGSVTADQAVRRTAELESAKKKGVESVKVDMTKVSDFVALYKTLYESGESREVRAAIKDLAKKRRFQGFPYSNVGVVLDDSVSMTGHRTESKNTPRAIAAFTADVIEASAKRSEVVVTSAWQTDLADAFCTLMERMESSGDTYDAVFVISDGYENAPEGGFSEALELYQEMSGIVFPVYHLSPVAGSETGGAARRLGSNVSSMPINKPESLMAQINSRLLEQDIKLWIQMQIESAKPKLKEVNQ